MLVVIWTVFLCGLFFNLGNANDTIYVTIPQGVLVGYQMTTEFHNKTYYSFKGIPYAKPMLGSNKFNPPRPPEPWIGLLNASEYREPCPQYNTIFDYAEGDEDCLYLNVYTSSINNEVCKPVMVWIHGGAFNFGQGSFDYYGGDYLVEHDVVVVTFNYRLGPIGFLNTGDKYSAGNMGLKDQTYLLRWVRDNIKYFGGCPNKVTLFGQDAGAMSVALHMLSPMSRGLFHTAISQSGSATDCWGFLENPRIEAFKIGKFLGKDTQDSKELVDFLKGLPSKKIIIATSKFFMLEKDLPNVHFLFLPSIDVKVEGEEQFLPDTPMNLLLSGDIADIPFITGVTEEEGALTFSALVNITQLIKGQNYTLREKFAVQYNTGLKDPAKISQLYKDIYKFYFNDIPLAKISIKQMESIAGDLLYNLQHHITATIINQQIKSNVYRYVFAFRSEDANSRALATVGNVSTHADDLEYIFFSDALSTIPTPGSSNYNITYLMLKMWTNFAKTGDPTSSMDDIVNTKWVPMGDDNNIMFIDLQPQIKNVFLPKSMNFWMPKYKHMFGKFVNLLT